MAVTDLGQVILVNIADDAVLVVEACAPLACLRLRHDHPHSRNVLGCQQRVDRGGREPVVKNLLHPNFACFHRRKRQRLAYKTEQISSVQRGD